MPMPIHTPNNDKSIGQISQSFGELDPPPSPLSFPPTPDALHLLSLRTSDTLWTPIGHISVK